MSGYSQSSVLMQVILPILLGAVSGFLSATLVYPVGNILTDVNMFRDEFLGFVLTFALSAGLVFGTAGGVYGLVKLGFTKAALLLFFALSILGMAAAFSVAFFLFTAFEGADAGLAISYGAASVVGSMIVMGGLSLVTRLKDRWNAIILAALATSAWSAGIAVLIEMTSVRTENLFDPPWLWSLFMGWQALFLFVLTRARRLEETKG